MGEAALSDDFSAARHRYLDATERYGRHRSPRFSTSAGSGISFLRNATPNPLRIP